MLASFAAFPGRFSVNGYVGFYGVFCLPSRRMLMFQDRMLMFQGRMLMFQGRMLMFQGRMLMFQTHVDS